jgi:hypothetical protein
MNLNSTRQPPNTAIGLGLGIAGLPFGATPSFGHNGIQFANNPLMFGGDNHFWERDELRLPPTLTQVGNETKYLLQHGQSTGVKVGARIRIKHQSGIWDYDFPAPPPRKFMKRVSRNVYIERVQIEKDGLIYELAPDSPQGPSATFPNQPPGYPIRPK